MSLGNVLVLYALVGLACSIAVLRSAPSLNASAVCSAVITVPLWPLWAPFALAPASARGKSRNEKTSVVARIECALADAVEAAAGTSMSQVFTAKAAERIASEVTVLATRLEDLAAFSERSDCASAKTRLEELIGSGASDRAVATARLQYESMERITALRAADTRALSELADLLDVLRTQLTLARYAGSSADSASAIVCEVWARLEGLGAVIDPGPDRSEAEGETSP